MAILTRGQQIDKYRVQSLIKESLYTETYRVEDEDFFQLAFPGIYDVTEDNRELVLEAINKTNLGIKVVKCCIPHDDVWVFFEILLDSSPEVKDIVPRALDILQGAQQLFYKNMN